MTDTTGTECQEDPEGRLTDRAFWESTWSSGAEGETAAPRWRSFADVELWDRLLPPLLGPLAGGRVLEVGCAPGRNLRRLAERFGLDPWGVEYTPAGAERTRAVLRSLGRPTDQVIEGDFFAPGWAPAEPFDAVVSFGFVEHFSDPAEVVARHLALLRPGGVLVVTLPNLRGLNGQLTGWLNPDLLAGHNLDLMTTAAVRALVADADADVAFCGGYGGVDVGCLTASSRSTRLALRGLRAGQWGINRALAALPAGAVPRGGWHSPYFALLATRRAG